MATFILYPRVEKLVCLSGAMPLPSPPSSARPPYACKLTVAMRGGENLSALHFRNTISAGVPQWVLIRQDQDRVIGDLLKEKLFFLEAPNLGKTDRGLSGLISGGAPDLSSVSETKRRQQRLPICHAFRHYCNCFGTVSAFPIFRTRKKKWNSDVFQGNKMHFEYSLSWENFSNVVYTRFVKN